MRDLVRGFATFAGVFAGVVLFEGLLATEVAGISLMRSSPEETSLVLLAVAVLALPGALGSSLALVYLLGRFVPDPRRQALRDAARALGLEIVMDLPGHFVASGTYRDRSVRLESRRRLSRHLTASLSANPRGYGLFAPGSPPEGPDQPWLASIHDDPVGSHVLQLLGRRVLVLPTQLHATGHEGWLDNHDILQERIRALLDLAQIAERRPTSLTATSLPAWASSLPDPRQQPALLARLDSLFKLGARGLTVASLLWLAACAALGPITWVL